MAKNNMKSADKFFSTMTAAINAMGQFNTLFQNYNTAELNRLKETAAITSAEYEFQKEMESINKQHAETMAKIEMERENIRNAIALQKLRYEDMRPFQELLQDQMKIYNSLLREFATNRNVSTNFTEIQKSLSDLNNQVFSLFQMIYSQQPLSSNIRNGDANNRK